MINLYYNTNNEDSKCNWVMDSLKQGWPKTQIADRDSPVTTPGAYWGFIQNNWVLIEQHQDLEIDWWFWDMPYWGRWNGLKEAQDPLQKFYWRVSKNSIHETVIVNRPADRFQDWRLTIEPWKRTGSEIVICPSSNTMSNWCSGLDETGWVEKTVTELKKHTDRHIRVRHKPRAKGTSGPNVALVPFAEDIKNAWAVVTSVSMCAVEAIALGIPVFCDELSFAKPVAETELSKIEQPKYATRIRWFNHLAYCQFTQKEIKSGLAYRILNDKAS